MNEDRKTRETWEKVWRTDYGQYTTDFGFNYGQHDVKSAGLEIGERVADMIPRTEDGGIDLKSLGILVLMWLIGGLLVGITVSLNLLLQHYI